MNEFFKLEKELLFKNNIKSIISISLDSEFQVDNDNVTGNFLITGEYKIHELSINKENFNFKIPFKHEIKDGIDKNTINLEITNFVYDYNKDELIVNIEYNITGERLDVLIFDDKETLDDFLKNREVEIVDTRVEEIKEIIDTQDEIEEDLDNKEEISEERNNEIKINIEEKKEDLNKDEMINNIGTTTDKYITYKVYKITETDTLESIILKLNTTIDELKEYNDINNINTNDKIIIPYYE